MSIVPNSNLFKSRPVTTITKMVTQTKSNHLSRFKIKRPSMKMVKSWVISLCRKLLVLCLLGKCSPKAILIRNSSRLASTQLSTISCYSIRCRVTSFLLSQETTHCKTGKFNMATSSTNFSKMKRTSKRRPLKPKTLAMSNQGKRKVTFVSRQTLIS